MLHIFELISAQPCLLLQLGVGLTRMAATPCWRRSAVALSVAEAMEAGFLPALDEDLADMFIPVVQTRSGPQVTNLGYPGLSQFIW